MERLVKFLHKIFLLMKLIKIKKCKNQSDLIILKILFNFEIIKMNIQVHTWIYWTFENDPRRQRCLWRWMEGRQGSRYRKIYSRQRSYIRRRMGRRQTILAQLVCKRIFIFIISKLNKNFNIIKSDWFLLADEPHCANSTFIFSYQYNYSNILCYIPL